MGGEEKLTYPRIISDLRCPNAGNISVDITRNLHILGFRRDCEALPDTQNAGLRAANASVEVFTVINISCILLHIKRPKSTGTVQEQPDEE